MKSSSFLSLLPFYGPHHPDVCYLIGDARVWQYNSSLPPPTALMATERPQDLPLLRLPPVLDVKRSCVFTKHVIPE